MSRTCSPAELGQQYAASRWTQRHLVNAAMSSEHTAQTRREHGSNQTPAKFTHSSHRQIKPNVSLVKQLSDRKYKM